MSIVSSTPYLSPIPGKTTALNSQQKQQLSKPDHAIFLLQNCKTSKELIQLHTLLIKTSLIKEKHAFGRLLLSFASFDNLGTLDYAQKLFDTVDIPRNSFMYTTMIKAYVNCGNPKEAFAFYSRMLCDQHYVYPNDFTFTYVFSACSKFNGVFEGKQAHAQMIKFPFEFAVHSWNSLLDFYGKVGEVGIVVRRVLIELRVLMLRLDEARRVFDEMPERDVVSWTIMLVGYADAGFLSEASCLFDEMPKRNLVSWSALIKGYIQIGCYSKALELFKEMQVAKVKMDEVIVTTLLTACARLGALDQGRWLHMYIDKHGIKVDAHLSTGLIDMYSKCGRIDMAWKIFQETEDKKVFVWSSMIGGLAMHSFGEKAIELFTKMIECGIEPSEITYINILAACTHSGLVDAGLQIFNKMVENQKPKPRMEHYGCIVDLLGRAGLLDDAFRIVETMPLKADPAIWRALLSACKLHRNVELGEQVGRILIKMEPQNDMNYVLFSNVYAAANRWEISGKAFGENMEIYGPLLVASNDIYMVQDEHELMSTISAETERRLVKTPR
ncbi:pentatricopeptide repeat-containing protein [Salix suchowensis]|nr:pentatricopeptide repeat-containing protein [Salix suchowensis]